MAGTVTKMYIHVQIRNRVMNSTSLLINQVGILTFVGVALISDHPEMSKRPMPLSALGARGIAEAAYVVRRSRTAEAHHIGSEGCHRRQPERSGGKAPTGSRLQVSETLVFSGGN